MRKSLSLLLFVLLAFVFFNTNSQEVPQTGNATTEPESSEDEPQEIGIPGNVSSEGNITSNATKKISDEEKQRRKELKKQARMKKNEYYYSIKDKYVEKPALKLNESNFDEYVFANDSKKYFVMLSTDFCFSCLEEYKIFQFMADYMSDNPKVVIGNLNCNKSQTLCKKRLGFKKYPMYIMFYKGKMYPYIYPNKTLDAWGQFIKDDYRKFQGLAIKNSTQPPSFWEELEKLPKKDPKLYTILLLSLTLFVLLAIYKIGRRVLGLGSKKKVEKAGKEETKEDAPKDTQEKKTQ